MKPSEAARPPPSPTVIEPSQGLMERWLVLPKILYFWLNMAVYSASSFLGKFFLDKWKMESYHVALLMSLQVVNLFGAIFWSNLADRWKRPRRILHVATIGYGVSFASLAIPVFTAPGDSVKRFVFSACLLSIVYFFLSALFPLIDGTVLTMLSRDPLFTKDHYNHQRLFGVPAHVLGIVLSGVAFKHFGTIGYQVVVVSCITALALTICFAVPSVLGEGATFTKHKKENGNVAPEAQVVEMAKEVAPKNPTMTLLQDFAFVFFLLFGLSAGICRASLSNFQTIHVEKATKSDTVFASLTSISRVASEVGIYLTAHRLGKAMGMYWLLILSQIAGLVRIFGYAYAPSHGAWAYFPFVLEVFKGVNSGLIVTSSVRIASDIAPPGCASSAQGLFSGTYQGLSMFIGGIMSAALLYYSGNDLRFMFKAIGYLSLVFTALFFLKFAFYDRVLSLPGLPRRKASISAKH